MQIFQQKWKKINKKSSFINRNFDNLTHLFLFQTNNLISVLFIFTYKLLTHNMNKCPFRLGYSLICIQ